LVERLIRNQQVAGSTPAGGSILSIIYSVIQGLAAGLGSNVGSNRVFGNGRNPPQKFIHLLRGIALGILVNVLVHVLREPNVRVLALGTQERNAGVAEIMKALFGKLRGGDQRVEFFQDLAVVDGRPNRAREDESGVVPSGARKLPLLVLAFLMGTQCRDAGGPAVRSCGGTSRTWAA
jgi:hypothetical protein